MRKPLSKTELDAIVALCKAREEIERQRRVIAHALKAIDQRAPERARELLWQALG